MTDLDAAAEDQLRRLEHDLPPGTQHHDYYAVLNVAKTASPDDIKDSFKALCRTFHPDKHVDSHLKAAAQRQFIIVQRAYDVLSDPVKRTLYDLYGPECPELAAASSSTYPNPSSSGSGSTDNSMQVGHVLKTPDEIRKEYEERIRREHMAKLESLIRQRGDVTIALDATPALFPQAFDPPAPRQVAVSSLQVKYSTDTPVNDTLVFGLSGRMVTQDSRGVGSVKAHVRKVISRTTSGDISINLLSPHSVTAKMHHVLDEKTDTSIDTDLHWSRPTLPPTATIQLTRRVIPNYPIYGFARFYSGHYSIGNWGKGSLATQITRAAQGQAARKLAISKDSVTSLQAGFQWNHSATTISNVTIQSSLFELVGVLRHVRKLPLPNTPLAARPTLELNLQGDARTGAMGFSWKLAHKLGEHLRVGLGTAATSGVGIVTTLELGYLGQRLILPISLYPELNLVAFAAASAVPLLSAAAAWVAVLEPRRKRILAAKLAAAKERARDLFAARRAESLAAAQAQYPTVVTKYARERDASNGGGLIILQALYGKVRAAAAASGQLPPPAGILHLKPSEAEGVLDVSIPVFALVTNSALKIEAGVSKAGLIGFWDPAPWEDKQLLVTYVFRGVYRQVIVEDDAALALPLRNHVVIERSAEVAVSDDVRRASKEAS
ncbi:hypothetical protein BCR44DRAFT_55847 [Catenaria anguillulae PL171]|uniref:J domain-containing protein n=1 Tax=Catenaria anguillulae PL171 TaxID=765915 RepID=A0A1Y2H6J5_9FUNG|nr:hypothetical protein BCR44DRAFT_55847 [Catenaria anguillulae PL171]